jgi:hypothetical protein
LDLLHPTRTQRIEELTMRLSGIELKRIRDALCDAFPNPGQLGVVVDDADIGTTFADVTFGAGSYQEAVHKLLAWAVGQYRLMRLLRAAIGVAPDNPELAQVAGFIEQYFSFLPRVLTDPLGKSIGEAERVLFKNVGFQNVGVWVEKLNRLRRVVCRIEPQARADGVGGYGTGFLVGPDVILTNDHVVSGVNGQPGFWGSPDRASRVVLRFDCEYDAGGNVTNGAEYRLAANYQVLRSPVDHLDFALLRLNCMTRRPTEDAGEASRGFATLVAHSFEGSEPLLILQHPMAEPMKLALGSLSPRSQWPPDRVEYMVSTDVGSSGSPCLTQNLDVAALHHWGSTSSNRGVLMSALIAFWSNAENRNLLLTAGLGHLL